MTNETQERVRIRLDVLDKIIQDLNSNAELEEIFGYPVIRSLVIVADGNDLRIETSEENLDEQKTEKFLKILDEVIKRRTSER
ncbi:MAG: hypothetical protein QXY62_03560 [Candidatus Altiarchaeota archaeon]